MPGSDQKPLPDDHPERRARISDMPEPRDNPSMSAPFLKKLMTWPYRAVLAGLFRVGARPWQVTVAALVLTIGVGVLLVNGEFLAAGLLLIPAGAADIFDGSLARLRGEVSTLGGFLDSGLDRVADMIVLGGIYWALAGQGETTMAALALTAMCVSLGVSFVRSAAEARGASLGEGLFQRLERSVALMVGLIVPGTLFAVLALLAALGAVTLFQRIWAGVRRLSVT